ncbi:YncE family protein [Caballeronia sp. S22]|uniref:YncE family protein n=1 Tax=Caballeronia sp. S22 TaxID=3137182 RepID=UPI0035311E41
MKTRPAKHSLMASAIALTLAASPSAFAFDGWHLLNAAVIPGEASGWDYVSVDSARHHVFLGHREEGLQVFDPTLRKVIKVIGNTANDRSDGAVLIPDFDLGISNNENGTITPFSLSTLKARPSIKVGDDLDTSHYDPVSKRLVLNMGAEANGTELIMLDVPSLKEAGRFKVPSKKAEGGDSDGKAFFFLAAQDIDKVYKLDTRAGKLVDTFDVAPTCGRPTAVTVNGADERVYISCRGRDTVKPSFVVLNGDNGKVVYTAPIGEGTDSIIYDASLKRILTANGVSANLNVFEVDGPDNYKPLDTLGTRAGMRTMAMDTKTHVIYAVTAESSADPSKKIRTEVSPFYGNTFFPNTYTVMTYGKHR